MADPLTPAEIERAMAEAVIIATVEGVTDPAVIRERKLEAREAIKLAHQQREIIEKAEAEYAQR